MAEDGTLVTEFCTALKNGGTTDVERVFTKCIGKTISIRDTAVRKEFKENFYHGLILGIMFYKSDWGVSSNGEAGDGFYDIQIEIEEEGIGIIIEVKYAEGGNLNAACKEALDQINKNNYTAELKEDDMHKILKYGIACYKKQCQVVMEKEVWH
ncbi:MAG: PD-(D/E)XK nuclease domain-containing protein [Lachnospiraceae bacterium]|nr:PD-(D/E)XK nuclease domain-containing protein [Lachnospiraceae bacterium]